jgi:hypothetical protein
MGVMNTIVELVDVVADGCVGLRDIRIGPQIDLLVLDAAPEALNKDVVAPGTLAANADLDVVL